MERGSEGGSDGAMKRRREGARARGREGERERRERRERKEGGSEGGDQGRGRGPMPGAWPRGRRPRWTPAPTVAASSTAPHGPSPAQYPPSTPHVGHPSGSTSPPPHGPPTL
eukprot:862998-Rhodomonas_salina.1